MISIINLYVPTNQLVRDDVSVLESFYNDVGTVFNELKNKSLVFLTGHWNSKVGKKIKQHASDDCIGSFARGVRKNSGQHLVDFCAINNLFISNTAFQHKGAHITTWCNKRVHPKDLMRTITVYNQIEAINARSFSRAETSSDHRLVICKLQVQKYNIFKNANKTHSNIIQLIKSDETKNAYQQQLHENLYKMECTSWGNPRASITDAAMKTIGFTKNDKNHRIHNPVVELLSNQQKELRLRINSTVNTSRRIPLALRKCLSSWQKHFRHCIVP